MIFDHLINNDVQKVFIYARDINDRDLNGWKRVYEKAESNNNNKKRKRNQM